MSQEQNQNRKKKILNNLNNDDEASKPLSDYSLPELVDLIEDLSDRYLQALVKKDKTIILATYHQVTKHYNERVGSKVYKENL